MPNSYGIAEHGVCQLLGHVPLLLCDRLGVQGTTMILQFANLGKKQDFEK
jgi:hypothetical protein